jgi:hypothetical protein
MLLFSSEVMSYFNAVTPVFQNKRFPQVMLPEYNEHFIIPLANFKAATKISESSYRRIAKEASDPSDVASGAVPCFSSPGCSDSV